MRTSIRSARDADLKALVDLYNRYILETPITFDLLPYSVKQRQENWFCHYNDSGRHRLLVAECDLVMPEVKKSSGDASAVADFPSGKCKVVGYASSSQFAAKAAYDTSVETSIYILPEFVHAGIGSKLYSALFQALGEEDVHRAYAGITLPNDASIAIHRKFGFEQVGLFQEVGRKFDRYWDVAWFEKSLDH